MDQIPRGKEGTIPTMEKKDRKGWGVNYFVTGTIDRDVVISHFLVKLLRF